ncbi:unnamed protein product [Tenebrio molitor]|nr:unnamed protein product [Tenebrio molitor]
MYLTAVFLLKYLGSYRLQLVALVRVLKTVKSSLSRTTPSTVNSSAREIVTRAVCLARPDERGACFEVVRWINVSFCCTRC